MSAQETTVQMPSDDQQEKQQLTCTYQQVEQNVLVALERARLALSIKLNAEAGKSEPNTHKIAHLIESLKTSGEAASTATLLAKAFAPPPPAQPVQPFKPELVKPE